MDNNVSVSYIVTCYHNVKSMGMGMGMGMGIGIGIGIGMGLFALLYSTFLCFDLLIDLDNYYPKLRTIRREDLARV